MKHIVVTGGNSGIGLALCKLLVTQHACHVFLGSRDEGRGDAARKIILDSHPDVGSKIEVLKIDVQSDESVTQAAEKLKARGVTLYALVNNAGAGLAHGDVGGVEGIMNTNYKGPKRVTEAMLPLIDPKEGRIVHTSSGAASMWLRDQDEATKALFSNPDMTQEELDKSLAAHIAAGNVGFGGGYAISKAALTALTMVQAKMWPNLKVPRHSFSSPTKP